MSRETGLQHVLSQSVPSKHQTLGICRLGRLIIFQSQDLMFFLLTISIGSHSLVCAYSLSNGVEYHDIVHILLFGKVLGLYYYSQ